YAKRPFGGPEQVLKYLARYTHRVAISNQRLLKLEDGRVTFRWKDYADGSAAKTMTLSAVEFLRRFLQHVLPKGFVKIRHYGFLSNRGRRQNIVRARELLGVPPAATNQPTPADDPQADAAVETCEVCRVGRMRQIEELPPV